jgi:hypothetical protein
VAMDRIRAMLVYRYGARKCGQKKRSLALY